ncbi:LacI family DNA-binding transcriptional regulator [Brevibacterium casei]|uniref:Transcriptional regulator, LacI family n=1 Tax=Brevibacterium casei CIP 102111 TaxID=1255625 RepID=A0A2H1JL75_9MICO|nr:LacI family DNA-binding transcriptional regulator [Brevibacterium casei]QPR39269.1 LacI family DNA-binding transcriptional regulator [Brevibacterium casei]QPR43435.1 LacI family DNA-binding transcriptional regulator [Brevibacterium casei]SMX88240.1 transcriptional regulator, LacI family [Brevibacterium casei CIP 102111]
MAEVAAHAKVSHQTVSRVVNGGVGVKPATRERVEAAIRELGYRRNNAARTLVTSRSGLIGVIAVGSFLYGPTRTLVGIEEAARSRDFTILLATIRSNGDAELSEQFERAIDTCLDRSVEAIIVIAAQEDVVRQVQIFNVDVPLIVVGPPRSHLPGLLTFSVDQRRGAREAVSHLGELGHSRILVLTGPGKWIDAQERRTGALDECAARGLAAEVIAGDWSPASGYQAGQALVARPGEMPTAIFSANDAMALGVLAAFNHAQVKVPDEVSIIGFDDIPEAAYFSPALTTVHQDFTTLGHRVLEAAVAAIRGEEPDMTPVAPVLALRDSTAEPAKRS